MVQRDHAHGEIVHTFLVGMAALLNGALVALGLLDFAMGTKRLLSAAAQTNGGRRAMIQDPTRVPIGFKPAVRCADSYQNH